MTHSVTILWTACRTHTWILILGNVLLFGFSVHLDAKDSLTIGAILCLLASFGFLMNDLCDREIDRLNRRGRLTSSSRATLRLVLFACIATAGCAILLAMKMGPPTSYVATGIIFGLVSYNTFLRRVPVIATLLAAGLCTSPIWFPLVLGASEVRAVHAAILAVAVVAVFAREIILDVRDEHGDRVYKRQTLPVLLGRRRALQIAFSLIILSLAVTCVWSVSVTIHMGMLWGMGTIISAVLCWVMPAAGIIRSSDEATFMRFIVLSRLGLLVVPALMLMGSGLFQF